MILGGGRKVIVTYGAAVVEVGKRNGEVPKKESMVSIFPVSYDAAIEVLGVDPASTCLGSFGGQHDGMGIHDLSPKWRQK